MAYQALYRSYRPQSFDEVVGQEHVVQTLKNAIKEHKISHAYVFSGLRGIGKTTIARILAKAVNCENPKDGNPCNECAACKAINEGNNTDIIELDAASNNGVDEIRDILEKVNFLPTELKRKVYIIDEVHMLTTSAFNALLKTLEEPPAHVMFVLATTEPHKIPLTILSRCQRFDFRQLTINELAGQVENVCDKEGLKIAKEAALSIAETADGGMRDALSILDQASILADGEITLESVLSVTGNITNDKLIGLVEAFNSQDATNSLKLVNELLEKGYDVNRVLSSLIDFCREILIFKSVSEPLVNKNIYSNQSFMDLAAQSNKSNLFYYIDVLIDTQNKIRYTLSNKVYLELAVVKITSLESLNNSLSERLDKVEEMLKTGVVTSDGSNNSVLEAKINALSAKMNQVNTTGQVDYSVKIKGLEEKIKLITQSIEEISMNTSTVSPEDEVKNSINDITERVLQLENTAKANSNTSFESYKNDFDANITELSAMVEGLNKIVTDLREEVANKDVQPQVVEATPIASDSNLDEIRTTISFLEAKLVELNKKIDEKETKDYSFDIEAIKVDIDNLKKDIYSKFKNYVSVDELDNKIEETIQAEEAKAEESPVEGLNNEEINQLYGENNDLLSNEPVKTEEPKPMIGPVIEENDITSKVYDIKLLERIFNTARKPECKEFKNEVLTNWNKIGKNCFGMEASIASFFESAEVNAACLDAICITFDRAQVCNLLMEPKNHEIGKNILKNLLGKDVEYIALPKEVYKEKRQEFVDKMGIGIMQPTLSPFNSPLLRVIASKDANLDDRQEKQRKADAFFGDDF